MKPIALSILFLASTLAFSSCRIETTNNKKRGPEKTVKVDAKDFSRITIGYPSVVNYVPSGSFSVVVKASESDFDEMSVSANGADLNIEERDGGGKRIIYHGHRDRMAYITVKAPSLSCVTIAGSGEFHCDTTLTADRLELQVAGSGTFDIKNIVASSVMVTIAGSGEVEGALTGVGSTHVSIAGSGDIDLDFNHCKSVVAGIAGSGEMEFTGDVETLSQQISGVGKIDTSGLKVGK